jgi:hypothetical protein
MSSILHRTSSDRSQAQLLAGLERIAADVLTFIDAMLNPGRIIAEVEQMRSLQQQATRLETTDPVRASALRQRAARIGLR